MNEVKLSALLEKRAIFVYEASRLRSIAVNAIVPEPWDQRDPQFQVAFTIAVAERCLSTAKPDPVAQHEDWMQSYLDMGWTYGPVRDAEARTHPNLVPWETLPESERTKDTVFYRLCKLAALTITEATIEPVDTEPPPLRAQRNGHTLEMRDGTWTCLQCGTQFAVSQDADLVFCGDAQ